MIIEIFDVGHGQCALITSPTGVRIMIDCGMRYENASFWSPSMYFRNQQIDLLVISNLDEDHLQDFHNLIKNTSILAVISNPTISQARLENLKKAGKGPGTTAFSQILGQASWTPMESLINLKPIKLWYYYNPYEFSPEETNNLSLVTFIQYENFKIVFSGDMETRGWRNLLNNPSFIFDIADTNIFVASHHGRENGICEELFDYFKPEIIMISDDKKKYETQETAEWYARHTHGARMVTDPSRKRHVITTRNDGSSRIIVAQNGAWRWLPIQVTEWSFKSGGLLANIARPLFS